MEIVRRVGGELVSADSMQIYRGLDIGTAKPTTAERAEIPHAMLDVADPHGAGFTVADWLRGAEEAIADAQPPIPPAQRQQRTQQLLSRPRRDDFISARVAYLQGLLGVGR